MRPLIHFLRRHIAIKLTVTLVVFVAVVVLAAGLYLERAFTEFAVSSLEARLALAGRVLEPEAREIVAGGAPSAGLAFVSRVAAATGLRVTLIATDGHIVAESERPMAA